MRAVPEVAFWTAACLGVWLLTLSSVSVPETVAAAAVSVACGVLAAAARRAVGGSWPPRARWVLWLLPLPLSVLADGVRVLGLAAGVLVGRRIPDGELRTVQLPRGEPARLRATRQAAAVVLVGASPGTVVLDVDGDTDELRVHALGAGRPRTEQVVSR